MAELRAIFAGGGTGGHLFPAIAIADEFRALRPGSEILFVGTRKKLESRVVPERGYALRTIWISGFRRGFRPGNLLFPLKVLTSMLQARSIIRNFHPDVVVGTGGYVSGPVLAAAVRAGIPTLIQEQNSYPGVTTRILARRVDEVHLTFESSRKLIGRTENVFVTGNPTRASLGGVSREDGLRAFGFDPASANATVLIVGGSLGAHSINEAIARHVGTFESRGIRCIWQTGTEDAKAYAVLEKPGSVWTRPFIDRMDCAYAAADLVVCRAGATTIAELTRLGKPAVLIPYPHAAANHQVENARTLVEAGAAELIPDHEAAARVGTVVTGLIDGGKLGAMSGRSRALGKPDAAREIARRMIDLAGRSPRAAAPAPDSRPGPGNAA